MNVSQSPAQKFYALCLVIALSTLTVMAVDLPRFYAYGPGLIGVLFLALYYRVFKTWPALSRPALSITGAILGFSLLSAAHALDSGEVFDRTLKLACVLIPGALLISLAQNSEIRTHLPRLWIFPTALIVTALLVIFELKAGAPIYRIVRSIPADEFVADSVFNRGTVAAILCVFPAFAILKKYRPAWQAGLLLGVPFLAMLACGSSQSAQLSIILGLLTFFFFPYRCRMSWIALFFVIMALIMSAPFLMPWLFTHFAAPLNALPVIGEGNGFAGARLEIWDYVSRYIQTEPLYGFGIEATRTINFDSAEIYQPGTSILHPHNFALQIWIEFGIVGAAAGALFCGYILRSIYRLGPCGARIALPVFMIVLSVGATGYGLWQSWWLGTLFMAAALTIIAVPPQTEKETCAVIEKPSHCCWHALWLWLPLASFALLAVLDIVLPEEYYRYIVEENGLLEILHFLVSSMAALVGVSLLLKLDFKTQRLLFLWVLLGTLGCVYISGEEISWGQQFFKWTTPDFWLHINDQQETNLHNTSSWLDQKPRLLLEIGVIVGGILLPLLARYAPRKIPAWLIVIAPPRELAVCAGLFVVYKICDKLGDILGFVPFGRTSEITELYVYWFILVYLYWLRTRYTRAK